MQCQNQGEGGGVPSEVFFACQFENLYGPAPLEEFLDPSLTDVLPF